MALVCYHGAAAGIMPAAFYFAGRTMDKRNLCEVARELFEYADNRDIDYSTFVMGAAFMHERLTWLIGEAAQSEDGAVDPAFLDWIADDVRYAQRHKARWEHKPPARAVVEETPPALPLRGRDVLSDRRGGDPNYAIFGKGFNPDRFEHFWRMFERDILPETMPDELRQHMKKTFLAGISTAFYDIAKIYVMASNASDPESFRCYLRDFRRSIERSLQPANPNNMH